MSVIAQTLIGLLPLIQQVIVDHGIIGQRAPLGPLLVLLVVTGVAGFATNYARRYLGAKVSVDLQHDLRLAIHRHLYELDFSRHDELSIGDVMSALDGRPHADPAVLLLGADARRQHDAAGRRRSS